jgi:hypothetical protein
MEDPVIDTHPLVRNRAYEAKVDGKRLNLYHCPQCGRDFAKEADDNEWRAARISAFRVDFLHDEQWASEPCPGKPAEDHDRPFYKSIEGAAPEDLRIMAVTTGDSPTLNSGITNKRTAQVRRVGRPRKARRDPSD